MSEYYAVIRSNDHLAHYGIKGMQWGVRKAIEKGSDRKLARQYRKAVKKLDKLNRQANIRNQEEAVQKHKKRAVAALGVGLTGLGLASRNKAAQDKAQEELNHVSYAAQNIMNANQNQSKPMARRKNIVGQAKPVEKKGEGLMQEMVQQALNSGKPISAYTNYKPVNASFTNNAEAISNMEKIGKYVNDANFKKKLRNGLLAGVTAAGLGTAAYQTAKAAAAKYRTTEKGHAKAVAKRDEWKREMNAAFKGTKYVNSKPGGAKKRKRR